ncbi:MAG: hypothetical protein V1896_02850 [Candidatus Zambryskibacteria bacterium]
MSESFGERLVKKEIAGLQDKFLNGVNGRFLIPRDRVIEINLTIKEIHRIHQDFKSDPFFRTEGFRKIVKGLERMLERPFVASH